MKRRLLSLLAAVLVLSCLCMSVSAHDVPELVDGSITFLVSYSGTALNNGKLTLYKVGYIDEDDGNYCFRLDPEIDPLESVVVDPMDQSLAKDLAVKAQKAKNLKKYTADIKKGEAVFDPVEHGLYVVVQTEEDACKGFEPLSSFLISQPNFEDGKYTNNIVAKPKPQLVREKEPTESKEPTETTKPGEKLPQTGQLNWPVPVLTVGGLTLFAIGWALRFGRKKEEYEE